MKRSGSIDLPLHGGKCPRWLFNYMSKLSARIAEAIIWEYGTQEFLKRLSDPYFFQSFGCLLGFDWHSSGLTTTVCGALKPGIRGNEKALDLVVAGGKGGSSRKTPSEIENFINLNNWSINPDNLIYSSKISAKVDNSALQDGYKLYHHNFIFDFKGNWTVIQQGMDTKAKYARRYHW